jgi:hypothetical protein
MVQNMWPPHTGNLQGVATMPKCTDATVGFMQGLHSSHGKVPHHTGTGSGVLCGCHLQQILLWCHFSAVGGENSWHAINTLHSKHACKLQRSTFTSAP